MSDFDVQGPDVADPEHHPATAVLLLSQHVQVGGALDLFTADAGGLGYLLKDRIIEIDDFLASIRRIAAGGSVLDPIVIRALVERRAPASALAALSERERDVLGLMAQGLSIPRSPPASSSGCVPSRPTSPVSSPGWGCCPPRTSTAASGPSSPTSTAETDQLFGGMLSGLHGLLAIKRQAQSE
ncbi:hypothetical protein [Frankia sp. CiP1_Cm_nod2]|uniref:hypothetical protein n=1 Tax=Frankia sp. CiP1_Cm_nod2 TaxID=2897161 RepID=UPI0020252228